MSSMQRGVPQFLDWKKSDLPFSDLEVWGYSRYLLKEHDSIQKGPRYSR